MTPVSESEAPLGVEPIERVGVVGAGLMGSGIAEVCARAGLEVVVREVSEAAAAEGETRIVRSLERGVSSGKLTEGSRREALDLITFTTSLEDLSGCQMVVEAVVEDENAKLERLRRPRRDSRRPPCRPRLQHLFHPDHDHRDGDQAARAGDRNPLLQSRSCAEARGAGHLAGHERADRSTARSFVTGRLRKKVIASQDRAGFVVNALLIPYILSAVRMFESGFATAEDIDTGMVEGCAHPMGPLALADLIGLDTTRAVADSMYEEFKEPLFAPPPLLVRMVDAGLLGRKTGRGFYPYNR